MQVYENMVLDLAVATDKKDAEAGCLAGDKPANALH